MRTIIILIVSIFINSNIQASDLKTIALGSKFVKEFAIDCKSNTTKEALIQLLEKMEQRISHFSRSTPKHIMQGTPLILFPLLGPAMYTLGTLDIISQRKKLIHYDFVIINYIKSLFNGNFDPKNEVKIKKKLIKYSTYRNPFGPEELSNEIIDFFMTCIIDDEGYHPFRPTDAYFLTDYKESKFNIKHRASKIANINSLDLSFLQNAIRIMLIYKMLEAK